MNRHWMSMAALLLSAWFGSGCLADAQPEYADGTETELSNSVDTDSVDTDSVDTDSVDTDSVDTARAASDLELDGAADGSMSVSDFVAQTKNAAQLDELAFAGDLGPAGAHGHASSELLGVTVGDPDDEEPVSQYMHGPDPQPWELLRKEGERLGPDPQPW